jgi:hypothetical protein
MVKLSVVLPLTCCSGSLRNKLFSAALSHLLPAERHLYIPVFKTLQVQETKHIYAIMLQHANCRYQYSFSYKDSHQNMNKQILGNDQLDALFLNVFILCLYMFQAASAHHREVQIVLIHHLV